MRITLENFRCWTKKVVEIDDECTTLISGRSGAGKTSILQAIVFGLYGTGTKVVSHGKTSCKVVIEYKEYTVTRTKRPNKVTVSSKSGVYEDDHAQSIINSVFGTVFESVSYIKQDSFDTFAYMSPSSKLEFLESLVFKDSNIVVKKERVAELIKDTQGRMNAVSCEIGVVQSHIDRMKVSEKIDDPGITIDDIEKRIREIDVLAAKNQECLFAKNTLLMQYECLEKNRCSELDISEIRSKIEKRRMVDEYSKDTSLLESISKKISLINLLDKNISADIEKCVAVQEDLARSKSKRESLRQSHDKYIDAELRLKSAGLCIECPSCTARIVYNPTSRTSSLASDNTSVNSSIIEMARLESICAKYKNEHVEYLALESHIDKSERELEDLELKCGMAANAMHNVLVENKKNEKYIAELSSRKSIVESRLSSYTLSSDDFSIPSVSECEDVYKSLVSKHALYKSSLAKISDIESKYGSGVREYADMSSKYVSEKEALSGTRSLVYAYNKYKTDLDNFNNESQRIEKLKQDLAQLEDDLRCLSVMKECMLKSENVCLENAVASINVHTKYFLDKMFKDNPISVILRTTKDTASKTSKAMLNIEILYKCVETDFSSLSGGEKARVSLALTLAIGELEHVPLLILDESIASLDSETTDNVFDVLRDKCGKTVIVVLHQATEGMFDNVLSIGTDE